MWQLLAPLFLMTCLAEHTSPVAEPNAAVSMLVAVCMVVVLLELHCLISNRQLQLSL